MKVNFKFTYSGDLDVLVGHHYSFSGGPLTNAEAVAYATAFASNYNANCLALAHPDVEMTECIVTDLTSPSDGTGSVAVAYVGGASGTPLAAGTATLINLLISRRYRGGKPRNYWPFGTSSSLNGATAWSSTFLSALASHYDPFIAANLAESSGATSVVAQVNVSYYKGFDSAQNPVTLRWRNINTPRSVPVVDTVNSYAFNVKPASQRRRNTQKR